MADSADFKKAADDVRNLDKTPSDEDYAKMYSLYKQATVGDCDIAHPGSSDAMRLAKFKAWMTRKGLSKEDAAKQYIEAAKEAAAKYGVKSK